MLDPFMLDLAMQPGNDDVFLHTSAKAHTHVLRRGLSRREQGHGLEMHIAIAGTRDPSGDGASFFWGFLYRIHRLHRVIRSLRRRDATWHRNTDTRLGGGRTSSSGHRLQYTAGSVTYRNPLLCRVRLNVWLASSFRRWMRLDRPCQAGI
jgi:hypothetical protein